MEKVGVDRDVAVSFSASDILWTVTERMDFCKDGALIVFHVCLVCVCVCVCAIPFFALIRTGCWWSSAEEVHRSISMLLFADVLL